MIIELTFDGCTPANYHLEDIPPWHRGKVMDNMPDELFRQFEQDIRAIDGFYDWHCDRQREKRGLYVAIGRNYNFTAVAKHGA